MADVNQLYELTPFATPPGFLRLSAGASVMGSEMCARFVVKGDNGTVCYPPISLKPRRSDHLWQRTCFELFIKPISSLAYWEFNFSPSEDWAVYRFSDFRTGMAVEEGATVTTIRAESSSDNTRVWHVHAALSGVPALVSVTDFQVGLTAVIEHEGQHFSYWALSHAGSKPDFHSHDGFTLTLNI